MTGGIALTAGLVNYFCKKYLQRVNRISRSVFSRHCGVGLSPLSSWGGSLFPCHREGVARSDLTHTRKDCPACAGLTLRHLTDAFYPANAGRNDMLGCHREGVARGDLRDCFTCLRQVRNDKEGCNHGGFAMTKRVSSQGGASPPCHREGSLFPCHREAVNTAVAISGIASAADAAFYPANAGRKDCVRLLRHCVPRNDRKPQ